MSRPRIVATSSPGEIRVVVLEDDRLLDVAISRPGQPDGVGDLHLGRIAAVLPALGGSFVSLGTVDGFLPDGDGATGLTIGDAVAVRISRAAQGGKGPRLTGRLTEAEQALCHAHGSGLAARGPDALARAARALPDAPILVDDPVLAAALRAASGDRIIVAPNPLPEPAKAALAELESSALTLPGGMTASIVPTPALVAIDVDGGSMSGVRAGKATAQFAANRDALPALLHQLRLRNLSGAILIDLAGLPSRKRQALAPAVEAALARDPLAPRLLGFTRLGLIEITRPRIHPPLHELLGSTHGHALAALRAAVAAHAARPGWRPAIRGAPDIVASLQADRIALADLARRTGHPLILRSDPRLAARSWTLEEGS